MITKMNYGKGEVSFEINNAKSIEYLLENPMNEITDLQDAFLKSVEDDVIGSQPLNKLIDKDDKITIIISDMTRYWQRQDLICELLVRYLHEKVGADFKNIVVVIAIGTHRKNSQEELRLLASPYVYDRVESVEDHDCDAKCVYIGTTSYGTEVEVNPLVLDRKVIVIGGTVHHVMAGYGGGRKSIVPGVASRKTIKQNHIMALDPNEKHSYKHVGTGEFKENPINQDMREAGGLLKPTFGINIVVNTQSKHSALFSGEFDASWKESCRYVQECYGKPIDYEADVVFVSTGGYPKDLNFYQSLKSIFNGSKAVKKGGTLVLLAECPEGSGAKDFFDWLVPLRKGQLDEALRANFTIGGYIFYAAIESINKCGRVLLLASETLEKDVVKDMGVEKYMDMDELMQQIDCNQKSVYLIPSGGSVVPQLKDAYNKYSEEVKK